MGNLSALSGLGPKSEERLNVIGIFTREELERVGPVQAYVRLCEAGERRPSLNFLYAMAGALTNRHWAEIARAERAELLTELEGYLELQKIVSGPDDR